MNSEFHVKELEDLDLSYQYHRTSGTEIMGRFCFIQDSFIDFSDDFGRIIDLYFDEIPFIIRNAVLVEYHVGTGMINGSNFPRLVCLTFIIKPKDFFIERALPE